MSDGLRTVAGPWLGALTDTGVTAAISAFQEIVGARLPVSRPDHEDRIFPAISFWKDPQLRYRHQIIKLRAEGLEPNTEYSYAIELDGQLGRALPGRFRTAPAKGSRSSFRFAVGSCARPRCWGGGSRPEGYQAIGAEPDRSLVLLSSGRPPLQGQRRRRGPKPPR